MDDRIIKIFLKHYGKNITINKEGIFLEPYNKEISLRVAKGFLKLVLKYKHSINNNLIVYIDGYCIDGLTESNINLIQLNTVVNSIY